MNVNTQQRARNLGHHNLGIPESQHIAAAKITRVRQGSAIETSRIARRLNDPDAFTPLNGECDLRRDAGHDDIGAGATDRRTLAQHTLAQWFANANLRVSG
jgi:hypothetical protein